MAQIVLIVQETARFHIQVPNVSNGRIRAVHRETERTIAVLHRGFQLRLTGNVAHQRHHIAQHFYIVIGKADLHSGLVSASLLRSAPRENPDGSGAEAFKNGLDGAGKAFATSKQKNYRGNAPGHAEHGEHGPAHVVPHGGISLFEKIAFRAYSLRSASTGCKSAALRAGYKPATTPEKASDVMAKAAVIGTSFGVSNPGGCGSVPNAAIKAAATPIPIPPINHVRNAPSIKNWNMMLPLVEIGRASCRERVEW